jgi:hypothetical protein
MSRDKGSKNKGNKNQKKAPADKSTGKAKHVSEYKSEGKSGYGNQAALEVFVPKPGAKPEAKPKP